MITFDIKDLYVNIPIQETHKIAKTLRLENNSEHTTKQMITLLEVTLKQNCFSFCNNIYQPEEGVYGISHFKYCCKNIPTRPRKHT